MMAERVGCSERADEVGDPEVNIQTDSEGAAVDLARASVRWIRCQTDLRIRGSAADGRPE